jgi:hypothetical protein
MTLNRTYAKYWMRLGETSLPGRMIRVAVDLISHDGAMARPWRTNARRRAMWPARLQEWTIGLAMEATLDEMIGKTASTKELGK